MELTYFVGLYMIVFSIQESVMQTFQPSLSPSPIAYVNEFEPFTLEFTGDGYVIFSVTFYLNGEELSTVKYTDTVDVCNDDDVSWRLYEISCQNDAASYSKIANVSWTIKNITESMHGDVWKVAQYHGEDDEEGGFWDHGYYMPPEPSQTPLQILYTSNTTIFIKGSIVETTVFADENNTMTIDASITKQYPEENDIFLSITVAELADNGSILEAQRINGSATSSGLQSDDGFYEVIWKADANMTDGEFSYNVTFSDIVMANDVSGTFCVGTACPTGGSSSLRGDFICGSLIILALLPTKLVSKLLQG